jgi:hypothetical protein
VKTALVLSGGGARGSYEVGVLSELLPELERRGEAPSIIVGTSVGAFNAAFLAANAHRPAADATRDAVAGYIRAGRARLAAAAAGDIEAVRAVVPLGAVRAGLLPWVLSHDRERLPSWLSTTELAWLGLGATDAGSSLDAFGAPVRPRIGCLCLQFPARRAPDSFTGRLSSGILMGAVPDLNLRLAELLAELHMPAALLPAVLAAATPDVVDRAPFRYPDDLRALDERVRSLGVDDVEQYLALLTTGGPLVPAREALENAVGRGGLSVSGPGDPFGVFVGTHPPGFVFSFKSEAP